MWDELLFEKYLESERDIYCEDDDIELMVDEEDIEPVDAAFMIGYNSA